MEFLEAPTSFYLGRTYDPKAHHLQDEVVYYDSRDLTTHAIVVGMTGSGKTGLCMTLLEEAVLDNVPAIVIDPKGDITNLLLAFPELRPEDFAPWINADDARRVGESVEQFAQQTADQWRKGLSDWGIAPGRIGAMKRAAQFSIYTPGSDAGLPISILSSLEAPREGWAGHEEMHRERIDGTVVALLALIGMSVKPVQDREHVLIANIFENAWKQGRGLTLEDIITQVQKPPFDKLGVFDINTFFPEKDRFKLAKALNQIVASPSFQAWLEGEPLDARNLLYTSDGRPRVSILYVAHLNDSERNFVITLLLESMLSWMRSLSGTTSLRALLYFDEMYGFFPPVPYNPPTKEPLLRLLKQARAFGVGLILATQNPGDLDYKGLSNAGTWIIGKLQTDNDREKVLSGLQGAATTSSPIDVKALNNLLASLDPRVFVLNNMHDPRGPQLLYSRWSMSYLRGPLTRQQVRALMEPQRAMRNLSGAPSSMPSQHLYTGTPVFPAAAIPPTPIPPTGNLPPPPSTLRATPPPPISPLAPPSFDPGAAPSSFPPDLPEASVQPADQPAPNRSFGTGLVAGMSTAPVADPPFDPNQAYAPAYEPVATAQMITPTVQMTSASAPLINATTPRNANWPEGFSDKPITLPDSIIQYFLPATVNVQQAARIWESRSGMAAASIGAPQLAYQPLLLAQVEVRYLDRKSSVEERQMLTYQVPDVQKANIIHWVDHIINIELDHTALSHQPVAGALFGSIPPGLTDAKRLNELKNDVVDYVFRSAVLTVMHNPTLDLYANPRESQGDFMIRLGLAAREARDIEIDKTTEKFNREIEKLDERLKKHQRDVQLHSQSAEELRRQESATTGESLLRMLRGNPGNTLSNVSRVRRYRSSAEGRAQSSDAAAGEMEQSIQARHTALSSALQGINDKWAKLAATLEEVKLTPYKKDIGLQMFGIGWRPLWYVTINGQAVLMPASL